MPTNSSYMRLAERGDLDRQTQERRTKGRMPMEGLGCNVGEVVDLSPGGACIRRKGLSAWPIGKQVVLVFKLDDEQVAVEAKVARVIKDGLLVRRYGMQFVNLSPKQSAVLMNFAKACRPQLSVAHPASF